MNSNNISPDDLYIWFINIPYNMDQLEKLKDEWDTLANQYSFSWRTACLTISDEIQKSCLGIQTVDETIANLKELETRNLLYKQPQVILYTKAINEILNTKHE